MVLRVAGKFDEKEWKRLRGRLRQRVRVLPVSGLAAECLAWERFEEIKQLPRAGTTYEKPKPWHALRIGLKKLSTRLRAFPEHHAAWSENLKRLQDYWGHSRSRCVAEKVKAEDGVDGRRGSVEADCPA